jgi:hypothetical protein
MQDCFHTLFDPPRPFFLLCGSICGRSAGRVAGGATATYASASPGAGGEGGGGGVSHDAPLWVLVSSLGRRLKNVTKSRCSEPKPKLRPDVCSKFRAESESGLRSLPRETRIVLFVVVPGPLIEGGPGADANRSLERSAIEEAALGQNSGFWIKNKMGLEWSSETTNTTECRNTHQ